MSFRSLLVVVLLIGCGGPPRAAPAAPKPAVTIDAANLVDQLTPHIESYGRVHGERRKLSGFVLVSQHDQPVYARGFGYADREHQIPATADTSFRIGSVTKQFTATAILLLAQDGKLAVEDPISKHLPDYPAVGAAVTIHQLLTHTSGIPSYTSDEALMAKRDQPITPAQLMASFADKPLEFSPGTAFNYSNSGYVVLGAIIEKVAGASYADVLRTRIFEPAGMIRTVVGDAAGMDDRALGYEPDGDTLVPAHAIDMSVPFAAGAIRSTANDLARWHRALEGDKLLTAESKRKLYTPALQGYAYGVFIDERDGHQVISHGGGIDGFMTSYLRIPDLDLVIVAWSNNTGLEPEPIAQAALTAALGGKLEPVREEAVIALDRASADRTVGIYALTEASRAKLLEVGMPADAVDTFATVELAIDGDQLALKPVGQPGVTLAPVGPTTYVSEEIGLRIEVSLPAEGPATKITVEQGGLITEFVRSN